ncbi:MAG: hypothetical protein H0T73_04365 [Ardenticatenales bacterium]|nr:hypothetical protein [Ardenticatenales bacterium]
MPTTLLELWITQSRRSWLQVTLLVGFAFVLLLVGTATLDGVLPTFTTDDWRFYLLGPAMLMYLLAIQPHLRRLRDRAIEVFKPLLATDDETFEAMVGEAYQLNYGLEWMAFGLGLLFGVLLDAPWGDPFSWLRLYRLLVVALGFGLLGLLVYGALLGRKLFSRLQRQPLQLNIFNPRGLEPIAQWSQGIALAILGVITLSSLFLPSRLLHRPEPLIVFTTLGVVALAVFFLTLLDTHRVMRAAKYEALRKVRRYLWAAYQTLPEEPPSSPPDPTMLAEPRALDEDKAEPPDPWIPAPAVASFWTWTTYEKRIQEAPEWPYTTNILRQLGASFLLPTLIWVARGVLTSAIMQALSLSQ